MRNAVLNSVRNECFLWLAAILLVLPAAAFGQGESDPWLILTNGEKGPINARTTRGDLVRLYGADDVIDRGVDTGEDEGGTATGTVLFPNDPTRKVEILWRDYEKKADPSRVTISGKTSHWHAVHGVSLGSSYKELERLNGRPFPISDGEQGSVVLSWNKGLLETELRHEGEVFIWFDETASDSPRPGATKDGSAVNPIRGEQVRRVNQMVWLFPSH
jgi:hypothetical protein